MKRNLTAGEQRLLWIFFILLYLCGIGIAHFMLDQEIRSAERQIRQYSVELEQLESFDATQRAELVQTRDTLVKAVQDLEKSLYPRETRIYDIGAEIREMLQRHNIRPGQYTLVEEQEPPHAEFEINGETADVMGFLKELAETETFLTAPFYSIKREDEEAKRLKGVIRISYEKE